MCFNRRKGKSCAFAIVSDGSVLLLLLPLRSFTEIFYKKCERRDLNVSSLHREEEDYVILLNYRTLDIFQLYYVIIL